MLRDFSGIYICLIKHFAISLNIFGLWTKEAIQEQSFFAEENIHFFYKWFCIVRRYLFFPVGVKRVVKDVEETSEVQLMKKVCLSGVPLPNCKRGGEGGVNSWG